MKLLSFVIALSCMAFAIGQSTIQPTDTTTAIVATTSAPHVDVPVNTYNFSKNGTMCLKARFGAQFIHEDNFWNVSKSAVVNEDKSSCSELVVDFDTDTFTIQFDKDKSDTFLSGVFATLTNPPLQASVANKTLAKVTEGSSYLCKAGLTIDLSHNVTFIMTDVQLQPFTVKDNAFGTAHDCKPSDINGIVPIIVGAVLAGLVVIVIIAYCVGRNRNRVGYEEI